ncbi:MAG: MBG domain-containing protein [Faecalibacillus faecis]
MLTREEGEDVGTYKIKVSQKKDQSNYDITFKDGTYTINPLSIDKEQLY